MAPTADDRRECRFEFIEIYVTEEIRFPTVATSSMMLGMQYFGGRVERCGKKGVQFETKYAQIIPNKFRKI